MPLIHEVNNAAFRSLMRRRSNLLRNLNVTNSSIIKIKLEVVIYNRANTHSPEINLCGAGILICKGIIDFYK